MSSDPQHKLKKTAARGSPSQRPKGEPKKGPSDAMATNSGPKPPPQRQVRTPVDQSSNSSVAASSKNPGSAPSPPRKKMHVILTHSAPRRDILCEELEKNYPQEKWFDSYDSLDIKMMKEYSKSETTEKFRPAHLPILVQHKNGTKHWVGLQAAVRDAISYLLDVEATWNPVTAITNRPQGISKPLWTGKLWLGGIKDSGDVEKVLSQKKCDISAVVSIHPKDWLTEESWKGLFQKWNGNPNSLQSGSARMQYHIELQDDSSSDLLAYFRKAFCFMDYFLSQGKNVLVHCKMGQSRSASLVLGYMMTRFHKTQLAFEPDENTFKQNLPNQKPSKEKAIRDFGKLKDKLDDFTKEISMPPNEPNRNAPRTETGKRRGVNTGKFEAQLLQYALQLAKGDENQPTKQPQSAEKKAGGGIIKDAALVLCFMSNLKPTGEILGYWSSRKKTNTNTHYWIAAAKKKSGEKDTDAKDHLASFNKFFEYHWKAREQTASST